MNSFFSLHIQFTRLDVPGEAGLHSVLNCAASELQRLREAGSSTVNLSSPGVLSISSPVTSTNASEASTGHQTQPHIGGQSQHCLASGKQYSRDDRLVGPGPTSHAVSSASRGHPLSGPCKSISASAHSLAPTAASRTSTASSTVPLDQLVNAAGTRHNGFGPSLSSGLPRGHTLASPESSACLNRVRLEACDVRSTGSLLDSFALASDTSSCVKPITLGLDLIAYKLTQLQRDSEAITKKVNLLTYKFLFWSILTMK
ncbi:unnamed protein product [Protopolystoma xenopodis]|uniref:Uncharacterized protein n=1 Tax=Protopolystoma xenopodis TaxID=117903 RepID=A0A3S4ZWP3_9PLAT|nr:unnamed protein product [Protopolystoma xenopodis]